MPEIVRVADGAGFRSEEKGRGKRLPTHHMGVGEVGGGVSRVCHALGGHFLCLTVESVPATDAWNVSLLLPTRLPSPTLWYQWHELPRFITRKYSPNYTIRELYIRLTGALLLGDRCRTFFLLARYSFTRLPLTPSVPVVRWVSTPPPPPSST